jgi:hypothetical protein
MCLLDIVAMLSVSSTKPQRFQPEQADGGIAPHFSGQQGNRLEKPETRPDPFFRDPFFRATGLILRLDLLGLVKL